MMDHDKQMEMARYDARAKAKLADRLELEERVLGSQTMPAYLRSPYLVYEAQLAQHLLPAHEVLELGAGAGLHTLALLRTRAHVVASDISPQSLELLRRKLDDGSGQLQTRVADMERTPFGDRSFDVITTAGSLSYGDPRLVDNEIRRLLRPGGALICVDSLNHNPVYRLNRWLHHRRGERSASTLARMPDLARIRALGRGFSHVDVHYFGTLSYAMPVLARFAGENNAWTLSDHIDRLVRARRSAFKFVLVAHGFDPGAAFH